MKEIINELYEIMDDRFLGDCVILSKELGSMKIKNYGDPNIVSRYNDLFDLLGSYIDFRDKLLKVKRNIEHDNNH